jgi:hypothetical protein
MTRGFLLFFKMRVVTLYAKHTHTHIYWIRGNLTPPESAFCGPR